MHGMEPSYGPQGTYGGPQGYGGTQGYGKGNFEYGMSGDEDQSEYSDGSYADGGKGGKTPGGKILDPVKAAKKQEKKKRDLS